MNVVENKVMCPSCGLSLDIVAKDGKKYLQPENHLMEHVVDGSLEIVDGKAKWKLTKTREAI